jgi:acyl transferase domain-containing protein/acyl carrier protein
MDNENTVLDPIAIIGMSLKVPGADNLNQYWHNLKNGIESLTLFTDEELKKAGVKQSVLDKPDYIKIFGKLKNIDKFDANFFDISPREAQIMDPQHRLFLECSWEVLESAGYNPEIYEDRIGVFAGAGLNHYMIKNLSSNLELINSIGGWATVMGNDKDFMPTRVSYKLNLRGPSLNISTGCSTSLVAIAMACQSLLSYQSDMIIAGGVTIQLPQDQGYWYEEGGIMSPDGHCKPFDADAKGTVDANGIGLVLLKRYEDALEDGDHVYALIKGYAINNDGSDKIGFTAPGVNGQSDVVTEAFEMADVDVETIKFIEAHGSGTSLGDPIEVASLIQTFKLFTQEKEFCALGSVKSNLGHLDAAAGVASLIKTVLAINHKQIPPTLHYKKPNSKIDFENSPFYVNNTLIEWNVDDIPRRAGVSSLGIGGTNAHVVLEEAPSRVYSDSSRPYHIFLLSAKTSTALEAITDNLAEYLERNPDTSLADMTYTLSMGRKVFPHKRMFVCQSCEEAIDCLRKKNSQHIDTNVCDNQDAKVVFMISGMGSEYKNMAKQLYNDEPVFHEHFDNCAGILQRGYAINLFDIWDNQDTITVIPRPIDKFLAPMALFVVEYCLAKLWISYGIEPEAMIGYSGGEYVAACLAEVIDLEDALSFLVESGQQMDKVQKGSMIAILKPEAFVMSLLNEKLSLAAVNGVSLCLVSGENEAVDELQDNLVKQNIQCYRIPTSLAFHSKMMMPIVEPLFNKLKQIKLKPPKIRWISSVTGTWITDHEATDPAYYVQKIILNPIRFVDSLSTIFKHPELILLEVGPGQILSPFAKQHPDWPHKDQVVLSTLKAPQYGFSESLSFLTTLGSLWLSGVPVHWKKYYQNEKRYRIPLPTYPFERESYWVEPKQLSEMNQSTLSQVSIAKNENIRDWFYLPSWHRSHCSFNQSPDQQKIQDQNWLIFSDQEGIGKQLIDSLTKMHVNMITVEKGEAFQKINDNAYMLNPSNHDEYEKLLISLEGVTIHHIVHLWQVSITANDDYLQLMNNGFYSLLFLGQTLGKHCFSSLIISVISTQLNDITGSDTIWPEKSTILGPIKVIQQEYQNINCRSIDIILPDKGSIQEQRLIEQIKLELTTNPSHRQIAFRGNYAWYQSFDTIKLDKTEKDSQFFRDNGVYLITGGLGNIGFTFAKHIATKVHATFILIGRSEIPSKDRWDHWINNHHKDNNISKKIKKIKFLEESGATIVIRKANVKDFNQMKAIVTQTESQFGTINGVIHAAGLVNDESFCYISDSNISECEKHFDAKLHGTKILDQLFSNHKLDFCLLCSSLSPILGGIGFAGYAAANAYLDSYVSFINQNILSKKWISVNWEDWKFEKPVGTQSYDSGVGASLEALAIHPDEGIDAFERILSCHQSLNELVVSSGNLQSRIDQWVEFDLTTNKEQDTSLPKNYHSRPDLLNSYTEPSNDTEKKLSHIWENILGISPIGIHDNFFHLGGNSLLLTQMVSKIRNQFQVGITLEKAFEKPDIESLAKKIDEIVLSIRLKKMNDNPLEEREEGEL